MTRPQIFLQPLKKHLIEKMWDAYTQWVEQCCCLVEEIWVRDTLVTTGDTYLNINIPLNTEITNCENMYHEHSAKICLCFIALQCLKDLQLDQHSVFCVCLFRLINVKST